MHFVVLSYPSALLGWLREFFASEVQAVFLPSKVAGASCPVLTCADAARYTDEPYEQVSELIRVMKPGGSTVAR